IAKREMFSLFLGLIVSGRVDKKAACAYLRFPTFFIIAFHAKARLMKPRNVMAPVNPPLGTTTWILGFLAETARATQASLLVKVFSSGPNIRILHSDNPFLPFEDDTLLRNAILDKADHFEELIQTAIGLVLTVFTFGNADHANDTGSLPPKLVTFGVIYWRVYTYEAFCACLTALSENTYVPDPEVFKEGLAKNGSPVTMVFSRNLDDKESQGWLPGNCPRTWGYGWFRWPTPCTVDWPFVSQS